MKKENKIKIAISGASGSVGRSLVPHLTGKSTEITLVGREKKILEDLFPHIRAISYSEISKYANQFDLFLHLAVINSDVDADDSQFYAVNVDFALETYRAVTQAGIRKFVYASSIHALDESCHTRYARSKREGAQRLAVEKGSDCLVLYLPAVVSGSFTGRLKLLNNVPNWFRVFLLSLFGALKPLVKVERIADYLLELGAQDHLATESKILTDGQAENRVYRALSRIMDISASLAFLCAFFWLFIIIWITIRLDSRGNALFRQLRVGRHGGVFTCYKFRTMLAETPEMATHEVSASSVTRFGRFLRRTKLDELPQFFNVLMGEMSLVGPRPCLPSQTGLIEERRKLSVLELKPGITGLAQVQGIDMSEPAKLAYWDRRYYDLRSFMLDIRILMETALGQGRGDQTAR